MAALVVIAVGMTCINLIFQYGGVLLATKAVYAAQFQAGDLDAMILLMFDLQHYGYILVQAFTGTWLFSFGYLVIRSGMLPRVLGVFLMVGGAAYLGDLFVQLMSPASAERLSEIILSPAVLAELSVIFYFIFSGVRSR